ncbi:MAG: MltA domain-containing protein, partial [Planctomycetes bacterium]|nr:MltA domain-containing protein [Planctomycetota bacterium]
MSRRIRGLTALPASLCEPGISKDALLGSLDALILACREDPDHVLERIGEDFLLLELVGDGNHGLFATGYYTPLFQARLQPTEEYRYPLYAPPSDLKERPYLYTRQAIDKDRILERQGLELAWLRDPLDAYLIHVQGSSSLLLPDGNTLNLGFADSNGQEYKSLGQIMVKNGLLSPEEVSLSSIRSYFAAHPGEFQNYALQNPRYIFFGKSAEGRPLGSMGLPVEAFHSVAMAREGKTYIYPPYWPLLLRLGGRWILALNQDPGSGLHGS